MSSYDPSSMPLAGNVNPSNLGTATPGTSIRFAREDHVHLAPAMGAPGARTLALATAYQGLTPANITMITINLTSTANFSLSGGTTNSADILMGPTNAVASGTGTVMAKYSNSVTGTIALGLNMNSVMANAYSFILPAGYYFAIRQIAGTITITSAFDQAFG